MEIVDQVQFAELRIGLAYQAEVAVNWCPALGTVLANEEVIDGKSERGGHPVVRRPMVQWMLRITEYAERLLDDLLFSAPEIGSQSIQITAGYVGERLDDLVADEELSKYIL